MKKTDFLSLLIEKEFTKGKNKYFLFLFLFAIGIISGTVCAVFSNSSEEIKNYVNTFLSSYSLQGTVNKHVFFLSLLNYIKFIFFVWISGWYLWLFPLCFLQILVKGFRIGFTVACFLQSLSLRGIAFSLITLLPQNLIFLPALLFFSVYQFEFLANRKLLLSGKNASNYKHRCYQKNFFLLLILFVITILCSWMEGYLIPTLLHIFSKLQ